MKSEMKRTKCSNTRGRGGGGEGGDIGTNFVLGKARRENCIQSGYTKCMYCDDERNLEHVRMM